ncbi:TetR/AcrR family transcriptional regulator [Paenibacillus caui]|uniref:TetR/AcrR family transcriptional regulator n=1 Tax=Paenibacillus caui TaxID=2873927 RepID=UPI001CA97C42|nr:TetR/AcrR family transcriptional regulator [Paenibacillus caui]
MPKDTFFNLSEEKQDKVMRSAISEFLNQGFEKGNIGEIAKQAGVAKGSMYQYFENKKELFLYSVRWAMDIMTKKYSSIQSVPANNLFESLYQSSKETWRQFKVEKELTIFLQDVFLGKFSSVADESLAQMMKMSDEFVLQLIRDGKKNGTIRNDIADHILALFMIGASIKFKQDFLNKVKDAGESVLDDHFYEAHDHEIRSFTDLLINGMGAK